ncbi:hypothetical protein FBQ81_16865 [Chloroflexi bacterium CFX6]|nr:hypothetical protein [Chloroflexi bacterium CFX6]
MDGRVPHRMGTRFDLLSISNARRGGAHVIPSHRSDVRWLDPRETPRGGEPHDPPRQGGWIRMKRLAQRALKIHERLLEFYGEPIWRNPLPAIDELVSTILSQNTNDVNRDRAFNALRAKFPTWEAVRDAKEMDVIETIRPAGLANQKGPRIQQVLKAITVERGDLDLSFLREMSVEEARDWLTKFNGVGPKTVPCGYPRLPRDGAYRTPPGADDRRTGASSPREFISPGDVLRCTFEYYSIGTRNLHREEGDV